MGLIYVNPEGPNGKPDPLASAQDIRETFKRMAMNDEETVALIAGGHTFGKTHGAGEASLVGPEPEAAPIEEMGLGWNSRFKTGMGGTPSPAASRSPGATTPTQWSNDFFDNLFGYEWELTKSPAGAYQWGPRTLADADARRARPVEAHAPTMLTTDLALRLDPAYEKISRRFHEHPDEFADAFARAWFKLTHRDMGPRSRYLGPEVPDEELIWQDPVPAVDHTLIDAKDIADSEGARSSPPGSSIAELVYTAWASASTFRGSDKRGGANGARIRLAPQKDWQVNEPAQLARVLDNARSDPEGVQRQGRRRQAGVAGRPDRPGRRRRHRAGGEEGRPRRRRPVHPRPHRRHRGTDRRRRRSLSRAGRRRVPQLFEERYDIPAEELLVDQAQLLTLTAPEMTVLVGGLRVLGANYGDSTHGVLTDRPGTLTNDFFVNLLDMGTEWKATAIPTRL